ncbi:hypothetical protein L1987_37643 [Smallanthus sonchifolius]|uniref:Uncharacterized protein n=1 Tax=Smallanthus sonchifolius TaxID=185202 RepID=A0ACB9HH04_9ASTR|nr:hypothetical protein L1987_37643 [Smallanthus sonchifolius]
MKLSCVLRSCYACVRITELIHENSSVIFGWVNFQREKVLAFHKSKSVPPKGTTRDANDDRLASLERELAKLKKSGSAYVSSVKYDVCGACGELGHKSIECQSGGNGYEEVNQVLGDRNYNDMNSNTYHPGLRNHPNFKYGNVSNQMNPNFQGASQKNSSYQNHQQGGGGYQRNSYNQGDDPVNSKLDAIMNVMKESDKKNEMRDKSFAAMERQVGQLAEEVAQIKKDKGKLPSDTTLNPSHQGSSSKNAYFSAVSTHRDGEESDSEDECELEEPIFPVKVGGLKVNQALLDYGSSVSILPGSIGVAVKVGEFYYPEDFLVLDYVPTVKKEQTRVILGRPFLVTANAQINCRDNTVNMTFGNRELNLNIISNTFTYFNKVKRSKAGATNKCTPWSKVDEGGTKEKGFLVDRFKLKEMNEAVDATIPKCGEAGVQVEKPPWKQQVESSSSYTKSDTNSSESSFGTKKPPKFVRQSYGTSECWKKRGDEDLVDVDHMRKFKLDGNDNCRAGEVVFGMESVFQPP